MELRIDTKCLKSAYESAILYLTGCQVPDARQDAWLLLEDTCQVTRSTLFVHPERALSEEEAELFLRRVRQRAERIPLQQILGYTWFYGLRMKVSDQVLCPRQDTEILVEEALAEMKKIGPAGRLLDLCTGSGCILSALLQEMPGWRGCGVDLSAEALAVAAENTSFLGDRAELIQSDLLDGVKGKYSLLVSNPPYIRSNVIPDLMEEVRDHEPHMALDGGEDGLDFYRRILEQAPSFLEEDGVVLFEIGYDQGQALRDLFEACGYTQIRTVKDLAGLDRVSIAHVPDRKA